MKRSKRFLSLLLAVMVLLSTVASATFVSASAAGTLASYYSTNPNGQVGKSAAISIDGSLSDWDSSMLIAQGTANDDPRVYRPNSMYELGVDLYALYGAYDDSNLYLMWEMTNVQDVVAPNDNYPLSQGILWQTQEFPFFIAVDTGKADTAIGNGGALTTGGTIWNSGMTFANSFNKLISINTKGFNGPWVYGGDSTGLNPVEQLDASTSKVKMGYGLGILSDNVYGIDKAYGTYNNRVPGDVCDESSAWVDFNTLGHSSSTMDFFYELSIPFSELGITKSDVEANGIGVMVIATMGMSAMDCLPGDPCMTDQADLDDAANSQENNSFEKSDKDNITAPFARVGKLGGGTIIPTPQPTQATTAAVTDAPATTEAPATTIPAPPIATDATETTQAPVATEATDPIATPAPGVTEATDATEAPATTDASEAATQVPATTATTPSIPVILPPGVTEATEATNDTASTDATNTTDGNDNTDATTLPVIKPSTPVTGEEVVLGDADFSGSVSIKDATLIQKCIAKITSFDDKATFTADVDANETLNIRDVTVIQKWLAKITVEFAVGEKVVYGEAEITVPTIAPTTAAPATEDDVTIPVIDVTTAAPTTAAPATEAPTTAAPATEAPTTAAPATEAPTTAAPATEAPATEAPATEAPATEAPKPTDPVYTEPVYTEPVYTDPINTEPDNPSGDTITVYYENSNGWGSVYWHAWSDMGPTNSAWPGDPMENVGGNVYKATISAYSIGIVFNDGSMEGAKTDDLTVPGDNQIYKNGGWTDYNGGGGDYIDPIPPVPGDGKTVYFSNNQGWDGVSIYCWNGAGGKNGEWPGESMTLVGQNDHGEDVYSYTVSSEFDMIIFSGGGSQTVDINLGTAAGNGFYPDGQNEGKWNVGVYTYAG